MEKYLSSSLSIQEEAHQSSLIRVDHLVELD